MGSLGWTLTQYYCCPYKKRRLRHRYTESENHVKTERMHHLPNQPRWEFSEEISHTDVLDSQLPEREGRNFSCLSHPVVLLCHGSPRKLLHCCHALELPVWPWNFVERDLGRRDEGNSNGEEEMTTDHLLRQRIESITHGRTGESFYWESRDWCVLEIIRVLQMKTNIGWASWDEMFVYC